MEHEAATEAEAAAADCARAHTAPLDARVVELNIGGTRFATTAQTLLAARSGFFDALLSGRLPTTRDTRGAFFVDRNGRYFEPVLDFMRTGVRPPLDPAVAPLVEQEAAFFLVEGFAKASTAGASPSSSSSAAAAAAAAGTTTTATTTTAADDAGDADDALLLDAVAGVSAASLRHAALAPALRSPAVRAALLSVLRAARGAADSGRMSVTFVDGPQEREYVGQFNATVHTYYRAYTVFRGAHRPVSADPALKAVLGGGSEAQREALLELLRKRGFACRYIDSLELRSTAQNMMPSFHPALVVYWGGMPLSEFLLPSAATQGRK